MSTIKVRLGRLTMTALVAVMTLTTVKTAMGQDANNNKVYRINSSTRERVHESLRERVTEAARTSEAGLYGQNSQDFVFSNQGDGVAIGAKLYQNNAEDVKDFFVKADLEKDGGKAAYGEFL